MKDFFANEKQICVSMLSNENICDLLIYRREMLWALKKILQLKTTHRIWGENTNFPKDFTYVIVCSL